MREEFFSVREWAREYRERGFAICRLGPGEKIPKYSRWNTYSASPEDFAEADNIGIQGGQLSGGLMCPDLDTPLALAYAPRFLPPTRMVEGRPGKPRSHPWYRVKNIPPEAMAQSHVAGGIGGPRSRRFRRPNGPTDIDLIGTGVQAAVPPSLWTSKDGTRSERRIWHDFGEPALIDCAELIECVEKLAMACGWRPPASRKREEKENSFSRPPVEEVCPGMPAGNVIRQARAFISAIPPAIEGQGGNAHTYNVACVLVLEFGLTVKEALPVLAEWNRACSPPWTLADLQEKLERANDQEKPRGKRIRPTTRAVSVEIRPGATTVFVGLGVAHPERSYVDLRPDLHAGMIRMNKKRILSQELEKVDWADKAVILVPASSVQTNKKDVWDEYHMAKLLRGRGAVVSSLRIPDEGRRRTLENAPLSDCEVVEPPMSAAQANALAEQASVMAKEKDLFRKSLPRVKSSPKLQQAMAWLEEHSIHTLTKEVILQAKSKGISHITLKRAMQARKK